MKNKKITGLIYTALACLFICACGKSEPSEPAAPEVEEEAEVTDPGAYEQFEESVSENESEQDIMSGALKAQYGYPSSYGAERERDGDKVRSYLTGKFVPSSIGDRRPVAIMLNNIKDAQPMTGVSYADVIYECVVEGALTRMMGIFENYDDLDKIGSVRSCRNYFVYYALELDSIYCHYGQSSYAVPLLKEPFVDNLSGLSAEGNTVFYRTTDREAPHNAYASAKGIKKGIEMMGYDTAYSPDYKGKFTFARDGDDHTPDSADAYDAKRVEPGYVINKPWFEYNEDDQKYYRFQYGDKQIDDMDGSQLAVDNIILQYSAWQQVDDNGYLGFDCHSGGKMTYITKGKAVDGTWIHFDLEEGATRYFDSQGYEIVFNQGKTWIEIIQDTKSDEVKVN